jgi:hypothetical protein
MVTAKEDFGIEQMLSVGVEVSCVFPDAMDGNPENWLHMIRGEP